MVLLLMTQAMDNTSAAASSYDFTISWTNKRPICLRAESESNREEWVMALRNAVPSTADMVSGVMNKSSHLIYGNGVAVASLGISTIEQTKEAKETIEEYWDQAKKVYDDIKSNTGLQSSLIEAAGSIGNVAMDLFPALLDIAKTIPFIGPVAAISMKLYESVKR
jgi:hypothetical protein